MAGYRVQPAPTRCRGELSLPSLRQQPAPTRPGARRILEENRLSKIYNYAKKSRDKKIESRYNYIITNTRKRKRRIKVTRFYGILLKYNIKLRKDNSAYNRSSKKRYTI